LIRAEAATGINSLVLAGIIAHESGWGSSALARDKNNLAGLGAYRAGMGMTFESRADCIDYLARLLAGRPGTLTEVGAWYAEDPGWAAKVGACVRGMVEVAHVIH
ncbi:MAG: glucosaminidase domain-containing protein, partial [Syntrophomonadaceae bacterium]|nr:glucosaminidase domain-containing protein [Syntrophomonadaceae bacterium]